MVSAAILATVRTVKQRLKPHVAGGGVALTFGVAMADAGPFEDGQAAYPKS